MARIVGCVRLRKRSAIRRDQRLEPEDHAAWRNDPDFFARHCPINQFLQPFGCFIDAKIDRHRMLVGLWHVGFKPTAPKRIIRLTGRQTVATL